MFLTPAPLRQHVPAGSTYVRVDVVLHHVHQPANVPGRRIALATHLTHVLHPQRSSGRRRRRATRCIGCHGHARSARPLERRRRPSKTAPCRAFPAPTPAPCGPSHTSTHKSHFVDGQRRASTSTTNGGTAATKPVRASRAQVAAPRWNGWSDASPQQHSMPSFRFSLSSS